MMTIVSVPTQHVSLCEVHNEEDVCLERKQSFSFKWVYTCITRQLFSQRATGVFKTPIKPQLDN